MQSRLQSLIESCVNVAIGYGVALAAQIAVFPLFGLQVSLVQNLQIGAIFTIVSIARSYAVRRLFNWLHRVPRAQMRPAVPPPPSSLWWHWCPAERTALHVAHGEPCNWCGAEAYPTDGQR